MATSVRREATGCRLGRRIRGFCARRLVHDARQRRRSADRLRSLKSIVAGSPDVISVDLERRRHHLRVATRWRAYSA